MDLLIDFASWRQAPDVSVQPKMALTAWRLFEVEGRERFLVGVLPNQKTLRVTTQIQTVDPVSRTWRTQSGRLYETPSPPTENPQLHEQMRLLICASGIHGAVLDVTDEVWNAMQSAVQ